LLADLPTRLVFRAAHLQVREPEKIVLDAISELIDEVSFQDIAEKIEFLAAIQKGWIDSTTAKVSRTTK
jgi:hypothetical protein